MAEDFTVTPWEVKGQIDYDELVERFGTQLVSQELLERLEKHASPLHHLIRRGIFYSHRDFDWILSEYEKGHGFFLYTGRGPSGHIHLGHMLPWILTKWLQDHFEVKFYFQLTDDEKFLFDNGLTREDTKNYAYENMLDVIALGFNPKLTKIFLDTELIHTLYPIAISVARKITFSTVRAVFGFNGSYNIGSIFYTSVQAVPCFLESELEGRNVACLIPCGIDQDPHFRIARDVAPLLGYYKPALLHNKLLPSLAGGDKMSASLPQTSVFTTDEPDDVGRKIVNAFTGGRVSVEEQRRLGADPDICTVYHYYLYFFMPDDGELEELYGKCKGGDILCGECKQILVERITEFLGEHQRKREEARDRIQDFILRD
ncbi:MAG: tryptophan--tRNA ligase [Thermoplasmata archaeon]